MICEQADLSANGSNLVVKVENDIFTPFFQELHIPFPTLYSGSQFVR